MSCLVNLMSHHILLAKMLLIVRKEIIIISSSHHLSFQNLNYFTANFKSDVIAKLHLSS